MKRTLVLKKESLIDLTSADLANVAAGAQEISQNCPTRYCYSGRLDCLLSQYIDPCIG